MLIKIDDDGLVIESTEIESMQTKLIENKGLNPNGDKTYTSITFKSGRKCGTIIPINELVKKIEGGDNHDP